MYNNFFERYKFVDFYWLELEGWEKAIDFVSFDGSGQADTSDLVGLLEPGQRIPKEWKQIAKQRAKAWRQKNYNNFDKTLGQCGIQQYSMGYDNKKCNKK